jgi:hypothetical protein
MKTVSEYLYNLYKPHLPQLEGCAESSIEVSLNEYPIFLTTGTVLTNPDTPAVTVTATFYSEQDWTGQILPDSGSLKFKSCCREEFPSSPRELQVVFLAKPGKETQALLDILIESLQ